MQTVAVAAYGRNAGSSRVRVFDWLDRLGADTFERIFTSRSNLSMKAMATSPARTAEAVIRMHQLSSDVTDARLILSRRASPFSNGQLESRLLSRASYSVYDFDDALASVPRRGIQRLWSVAETWKRSVKTADCVIAGNAFLAEQASGLAENITIIPSCVEMDSYEQKTSYEIQTPLAVWIGSPSTEPYLDMISDPLLRLHETLGMRLLVVSAGNRSLGALDRMVDRAEWSPRTFAVALSRADFGIMPLPDDEWTRGKCAYKLLQYGASGLPLIGSPVGVNKDVLEMADGYAPETSTDWFDCLKDLVGLTEPRRRQMGRSAFHAVSDHYSFDAWESRWKHAVKLE